MKKIAHIENNKIVNISLHEKAPKGKQYLDVTDSNADIGDEVLKGQVVSQNAHKDLEAARQHVLQRLHHDLQVSLHDLIGSTGFCANSLPELWLTYDFMGDSQVVTMPNDIQELRQYSKKQLLDIINEVFSAQQDYYRKRAVRQLEIESAKSVADLKLPAHMVHPEAK